MLGNLGFCRHRRCFSGKKGGQAQAHCYSQSLCLNRVPSLRRKFCIQKPRRISKKGGQAQAQAQAQLRFPNRSSSSSSRISHKVQTIKSCQVHFCHDFIFIIYNGLIYNGPWTIRVTPSESQVRKSLKAHKASKEVLWSPLLANQWAGKRASSGHLTNSRLAFNCFSQLLIWLDSVVKASMYLKNSKLFNLYFKSISNFIYLM